MTTNHDGVRIVEQLRQRAAGLGFSLFGIAPAVDADGFGRFCDWLDRGHAAGMQYLHKHRDARQHPRSILESVRSVIMLGLEYDGRQSNPNSAGQIASYAQGPDYHELIWDRLNQLSDWLNAEVPDSYTHGIADTAPLLERDFARRAGLGWFGKNTMLINKYRGSYCFLAGLLTTIELPHNQPHDQSHCGTCTACLDACPTQAFPEPGILDARRCISYLTIEHRGAIEPEFRPLIGNWLFGCDICQDVCPWNRRVRNHTHPPAFPHDPSYQSFDPVAILSLDEAGFRKLFRSTAISRAKRSGLRRNAAIVLGNVGQTGHIPILKTFLHDPDEVVREACAWAIRQIENR